MNELLKVNGPQGTLPSVYYMLDGNPISDSKVGEFLCKQVTPEEYKEGDLIVHLTPSEYEIALKALGKARSDDTPPSPIEMICGSSG